ncbi:MAG: iron-containing alcohol dehydrogenase [Acidobacteria bacterium]|nr:iron-containing alcohol dehydrogenase [Acidobacteriota bacterium]
MRFDSPRTILHGQGTRHELVNFVKQSSSILIVTDHYLLKSGQLPQLPNAHIFANVQPDPTEANVTAGLAIANENAIDTIVAFGGGSPIDCAKAIRHAYKPVPLIVIPTTAGTGSEATPVMVITDESAGIKRMTRDTSLMPDIAIIDAELSSTMPRPLTAHVGVDTLTHGIEAFVSKKRHTLSNLHAITCIERCHQHLRLAWQDGTNMAARESMALAALHGGLAFGNSSVALVHGMSRPLGALFHIPHGLSNAVLLPEVTRFSYVGDETRYNEVARLLGISPTLESLLEYLQSLNADLEVPRLRDCCQHKQERFEQLIPKMALDALASGSPANNPRIPTVSEIEAIYRAAW